jgi:hypothetical protein
VAMVIGMVTSFSVNMALDYNPAPACTCFDSGTVNTPSSRVYAQVAFYLIAARACWVRVRGRFGLKKPLH